MASKKAKIPYKNLDLSKLLHLEKTHPQKISKSTPGPP